MAIDQSDIVLRHIRRLVAAPETTDQSDAQLLQRFAAHREEDAFAALVQRYGRLVWDICRRVLGDFHDAEDAFQATFLVLARKAESVRKREALASWLHGVSYRVALQARRNAAIRRKHERQGQSMAARKSLPDDVLREALALLDEEVHRLPSKEQAAFVLRCLEGKSQAETARQLGWKEGTVSAMLARARQRLRQRLTNRGVTLSAVLAALALGEEVRAAALPAGLAQATLNTAMQFTAGGRTATALTSEAAALAEGVTKAMFMKKVQTLTFLVLAFGLLSVGATLQIHRSFAEPGLRAELEEPAAVVVADPPAGEVKKTDKSPELKAADAAGDVFTYTGRVLGPDGKPLAKARLFIHGLTPGVIEFRKRAESGPDGTFRFSVRRAEFGDKGVVPLGRSPPEGYVNVAATADGCGAACVWAGKPEERENLTLWLPAEEIVKGRVVDTEGKPMPGVDVNAYIRSSRAARDHKPLPFDAPADNSYYSGNILPHEEGRMGAVTDKDGRVTLRGLSRGWLYDLSISGPTVVSTRAQLVARPDKLKEVPGAGVWTREKGEPKLTRYGSEFTFVAVPCKPILGVVRDKGSGKPLAEVGLGREWTRDDEPHPWTTTDKEGRYKLIGLPPGVHTLKVEPPSNSPYLAAEFRVHADRPNIEAVSFDIQLERQRAVSGRVIDRKTSKPVQCWVEYRPLAKNPNLSGHPLLAAPQWRNHPPSSQTDAAGRFTLPSLAGPGVLLVRTESDYLPAVFEKADRAAGIADPIDPELIDCRPLLAWPKDFHAYRLIDVQEGKDAEVEIALTPGGTRPLLIEFPDGKPHDTTLLGLKPLGHDQGDQFYAGKSAVICLADGESRRLFVSTQDGHFAAATVVSAGETGPVTVKLKPTGTITGRVVDKDGKPIAGASFQTLFEDGSGRPGVYVHGSFIRRLATPAESKRSWRTKGYDVGDKLQYVTSSDKSDDKGRFHLTGILPDAAFDLNVQLVSPPDAKKQRFITGMVKVARATVKAGETLDLGEVQVGQAPKR